jgi:1-deoxy-D-xylulose-5-phosphate reductoisomerase
MNQQLDFQEPDTTRFPALKLARQAMQSGGLAPAILNAANEIAVAAFLKNSIGFTEIPQVVEQTLNQVQSGAAESIELILQVDRVARSVAQQIVINKGN